MCNEVELDPATQAMVKRRLKLQANPELDPNLYYLELALTTEQMYGLGWYIRFHSTEGVRQATDVDDTAANAISAFKILLESMRNAGMYIS